MGVDEEDDRTWKELRRVDPVRYQMLLVIAEGIVKVRTLPFGGDSDDRRFWIGISTRETH